LTEFVADATMIRFTPGSACRIDCMSPPAKSLEPVVAQPGKPLYIAARDAVRAAIDAGVFTPGEQMPSTKQLSRQLAVSLVTAHRALQELVGAGVLHRARGKGTFVHERYLDRKSRIDTRIGIVFHREASIGDYYHGQIFEGVRQAAQDLSADLILLRFGEDVRNECHGYLFVNPLPDELEQFTENANPRQPVLVVGATSHLSGVRSIDVDNVELARRAVEHLCELGHRRIGYVGGGDQISNSRDRWRGFVEACADCGVNGHDEHVVKGAGWRLTDRERLELVRILTQPSAPTAIFAGGYYFALDVYAAAGAAGLCIPEELSVVGVDDPPSAAHLSPPMTTLRQPLVQLGHAAVTALHDRLHNGQAPIESRQLRAELIIRRSTARAAT
jgi:LacI family transcriptional regulator